MQAINNSQLSACFKEIDDVVAVSIPELLKVAEDIKRNNQRSSRYDLQSHTQNIPIKIDGYYMRVISNRVNEVREICNHLFPGANF